MKIERLITIIMILLQREVISAGELARRLEVSRRTIYRDIDTLNMAGLPIFTSQGATGGVGLMKSYKIDHKLFTPSDVQLLAASLGSYKQLYGHKEWANILAKVDSLAQGERPSTRAAAFSVDLSLNAGNRSLRTLLSVIENGINEQHCIQFDYIDKNGRVTRRQAEPYHVVFKESSWYLQAYCTDKKDYRIFKLARMDRVGLAEERYVWREFTPLPMDGADWMNQERVPVVIRIDLAIRDKVIERYGAENILTTEGDHCLAAFPIVNNEYGYQILLGFGDQCEIIAPAEIRNNFRIYLQRILAKYNENGEGTDS
ncbi:MAG: transcriptional regulator [Paenibacillaceae bacterium]|jgi:predicted DNA-binding transcriptional regulator YafY|nr:transcriptional regulator [Paenibacillaceae bacterium]